MEGYRTKDYGQPVKRYVQTMELKDNPELIRKYKEAHSEDQVGILEMEIYIAGPRLVMICDTPLDFQWDEAMAKLATLPRQQEWEEYVAAFQQCDASATSDQKWQMMERMFRLW